MMACTSPLKVSEALKSTNRSTVPVLAVSPPKTVPQRLMWGIVGSSKIIWIARGGACYVRRETGHANVCAYGFKRALRGPLDFTHC